MLQDNKDDLYKIQQPKTVADFIEEKDEIKNIMFNKFKQIRKEFLCSLGATLVVAFLLWYLFISDGIYNNSILTFLFGAIFVTAIAFDIKIFKGFKDEAARFDFRVRSLLGRFEKYEVILTLDENEINDTVAEAYKKYGIKKRWLVYFFIIAVVLITAFAKISIYSETFTQKKWKNIDNRPKIEADIYSDIIYSFDYDNVYEQEPKYDFSKMSDNEVHALLGQPEVTVTSNIKGDTIINNSTYQNYMGSPPEFTYFFNTKGQTVVCEQYYCGTIEKEETPTWLCLFWLDGKLMFGLSGMQNMTQTFNYEINKVLFEKNIYEDE